MAGKSLASCVTAVLASSLGTEARSGETPSPAFHPAFNKHGFVICGSSQLGHAEIRRHLTFSFILNSWLLHTTKQNCFLCLVMGHQGTFLTSDVRPIPVSQKTLDSCFSQSRKNPGEQMIASVSTKDCERVYI